jgi:hypothetical protein
VLAGLTPSELRASVSSTSHADPSTLDALDAPADVLADVRSVQDRAQVAERYSAA